MRAKYSVSGETLLIDRTQPLTLTAPEMTVLLGGLRAPNTKHGVFTDKSESLGNDFFVNLLDISTAWYPVTSKSISEGKDRSTRETKWTATRVDLLFGSYYQLRAIAEVYAESDSQEKFIHYFIAA